MQLSMPGNQPAAFGPWAGRVRFGADEPEQAPADKAAEASIKPESAQDASDEFKRAADTDNADAKSLRENNRRVAASMFFKTALPLASIALWLLGIPGIAAGLGVSYVSGRIGRRVENKIDESQLTGTAQKARELLNSLADPNKLKDEDAALRQVNGLLDEALEPSKLAAIPVVGQLAKLGFVAKALKMVRIPMNSRVADLVKGYVRMKQVRSLGNAGAGMAAASISGKAFILLSAAGVNHAVAQTAAREQSNLTAVPKAAWEAASRIFFLKYFPKLLGPLTDKLGKTAGPLGKWAADMLKAKAAK